MSLLDTLLGLVTGKPADGQASTLQTALSGLLSQSGGLEGLKSKFSANGLGDIFSSWVGMGENKSVSADQVHSALGSEQISALASQLGVDPSKASGFLATYLPKIIDKLTPSGQVEGGGDASEGLAALLPSLLSSMGGDEQKPA